VSRRAVIKRAKIARAARLTPEYQMRKIHRWMEKVMRRRWKQKHHGVIRFQSGRQEFVTINNVVCRREDGQPVRAGDLQPGQFYTVELTGVLKNVSLKEDQVGVLDAQTFA